MDEIFIVALKSFTEKSFNRRKKALLETYENLQETLNDGNDDLMPLTHEFLHGEQNMIKLYVLDKLHYLY